MKRQKQVELNNKICSFALTVPFVTFVDVTYFTCNVYNMYAFEVCSEQLNIMLN